MARPRATGRGSPEAVEKRRAARALNTIVARTAGAARVLDGRTEERRRRLLAELKEGRRGTPLKPIDVVTHASELFDLGESLASLRRQGVKPLAVPPTPEIVEAAKRVQSAYGLHRDAFKLIGVDIDAPPPPGRGKGGS
jgi:hypothetical protein